MIYDFRRSLQLKHLVARQVCFVRCKGTSIGIVFGICGNLRGVLRIPIRVLKEMNRVTASVGSESENDCRRARWRFRRENINYIDFDLIHDNS